MDYFVWKCCTLVPHNWSFYRVFHLCILCFSLLWGCWFLFSFWMEDSNEATSKGLSLPFCVIVQLKIFLFVKALFKHLLCFKLDCVLKVLAQADIMGTVYQEKTCFIKGIIKNFHVEIKNQILALDRPEFKSILMIYYQPHLDQTDTTSLFNFLIFELGAERSVPDGVTHKACHREWSYRLHQIHMEIVSHPSWAWD